MIPSNNNGEYLRDIEGLGFANDGTLYGTTGESAGSWQKSNSLYQIDISTAEVYYIGSFLVYGRDVEGCDCLSNAPNNLSGYVYTDVNNNNIYDSGEAPLENINLRIYLDLDGSNTVSSGDILLDSISTNSSGYYSWATASPEDYVIELDASSLPENYTRTSTGDETAIFSTAYGGMNDEENNFGATDPAFPVEWLGFRVTYEGNYHKLQWETAHETHSDYFLIERMANSQQFDSIGTVKASGNTDQVSTYFYIDKHLRNIQKPIIYYRLKQVDLDGNLSYSQTVNIALKQGSVLAEYQSIPQSRYRSGNYRLFR